MSVLEAAPQQAAEAEAADGLLALAASSSSARLAPCTMPDLAEMIVFLFLSPRVASYFGPDGAFIISRLRNGRRAQRTILNL